MLDLGDMPAADGDTHSIEANRLERIMLHEIATCDAAVAALLLGVHGLLGKDPRGAIQRNASGLDLGHHHDIVELIEQHQIGLALGATIALLQQGVAALVKVVDGDQLAQHA